MGDCITVAGSGGLYIPVEGEISGSVRWGCLSLLGLYRSIVTFPLEVAGLGWRLKTFGGLVDAGVVFMGPVSTVVGEG